MRTGIGSKPRNSSKFWLDFHGYYFRERIDWDWFNMSSQKHNREIIASSKLCLSLETASPLPQAISYLGGGRVSKTHAAPQHLILQKLTATVWHCKDLSLTCQTMLWPASTLHVCQRCLSKPCSTSQVISASVSRNIADQLGSCDRRATLSITLCKPLVSRTNMLPGKCLSCLECCWSNWRNISWSGWQW